jgi:tetratricopeptide (TPR) repeat protein
MTWRLIWIRVMLRRLRTGPNANTSSVMTLLLYWIVIKRFFLCEGNPNPIALTNALFNRGLAQTRLENYDACIRDFTTLLQFDPINLSYLFNRVYRHFSNNGSDSHIRLGIEDFTNFISQDTSSGLAYYYRSILLANLGDEFAEEAFEDYYKAVELDPSLKIEELESFRDK